MSQYIYVQGYLVVTFKKGKTRQKNYSGQKHLPFSVILWSLALRICQSLSLIHVHLVHKHLVANNELNQSFSPEQ